MTAAPVEKRVDTLTRAAAKAHEDLGPLPRAMAAMFEEFARLDTQGIHPPTSVVTLARTYLGETS